eukprot:TRINITY_DN3982_c0_g1_i1.p1 TRINITY_DN3982_c0_g1~~TRINITY_DN3982_c0_g1_i1.p1  ORF type:complete len:422 (+),score=85.19 TRINITY_DN3982_c0_g1_i1:96-1361(+)
MTDTEEINVEYVLLAEFDVDKGVTLRQQYPKPITKDAESIGSLMLPDGAHHRDIDWVTFLVKVPLSDVEDNSEYIKFLEKKRKKGSFLATAYIYRDNEDWAFLGDCDKPCAVWIQESTLHIRSPSGIDIKIEAHRGLSYTVDQNQMHIVHNKYGIAYALHFPQHESQELFRKQMQEMQFNAENDELASFLDDIMFSKEEEDAWKIDEVSEHKLMYCHCLVKTMRDSGFRRGASMKSIAICSSFPFVHIFKEIVDLALSRYFDDPSESVLVDLYDSLNMLDMKSIPRLSPAQKSVCRNMWLSTRRMEKKFELSFVDTKKNCASTLMQLSGRSWRAVLDFLAESVPKQLHDNFQCDSIAKAHHLPWHTVPGPYFVQHGFVSNHDASSAPLWIDLQGFPIRKPRQCEQRDTNSRVYCWSEQPDV